MNRKKKNIWDDIKSMGSGFTTPSGYFDALEDQLKESHEHLDEPVGNSTSKSTKVRQLEHTSVLDQIQRKHGFSVPKGYFEQNILMPEPNASPKVISLGGRNLRLLYMSIAASVLLFFGIQYMNKVQSPEQELVLQEEEIAGWIENDLITFSSNEIAEAYSDIELENAMYPEDEVYSYLNYMDIENLILEN